VVKFLVLALFYGDHPALAQRCGETLRRLGNTGQVDLRVGLNEVAPCSRAILANLLPGVPMESTEPQIYKYPMMRKLLEGYAGDATHMMWFDDDSCLLPHVDARRWLAAVGTRAAQTEGTLGSLYERAPTEAQSAWIARQPWYRGLAIPQQILFNTGGWITVPLALMRRWGWPGPDLLHNGGDVTLGALLHQQGLAPEQFRVGLAINADAQLRESAAPRRGFQETAETAIWGIPEKGTTA
jgi:hypothetical protein